MQNEAYAPTLTSFSDNSIAVEWFNYGMQISLEYSNYSSISFVSLYHAFSFYCFVTLFFCVLFIYFVWL